MLLKLAMGPVPLTLPSSSTSGSAWMGSAAHAFPKLGKVAKT